MVLGSFHSGIQLDVQEKAMQTACLAALSTEAVLTALASGKVARKQ
jgi:hypothetical protein